MRFVALFAGADGRLDARPFAAENPAVSTRRSWLLRAFVLGLFVLVATLPGLSTADVGQRLPRLRRLSDEVVRGGMPLGYVPLRQIWSDWDQGDPQEVEESLHSIAGDARVAPPLRVYSGLLEAYARRRRG